MSRHLHLFAATALLAALVFTGPGPPTRAGSTQLFEFEGENPGDRFGFAVACGDVNRDRYGDIVVGAILADPGGMTNAGSVFVYSGKDGSLLHRFDGKAAFDHFGWAVLGCDLNRDRYYDIVIGAPVADSGGRMDAGKVIVFSALP